MKLRLLSLNTWAGTLYDDLMSYVKELDADVMCLQEVLRGTREKHVWLSYRDQSVDLRQRANLFDELLTAFPDHDAYFCPSMRGELLDGVRPVSVEFGLATLIRRTYSVIAQAMDFVHGSYSPYGWGDHPRARNAHVFRIFDPCESSIVTIAHVHGLRSLDGKHDNDERTAQAQRLLSLIEHVRRPHDKLIACGDLNVLPDSVTFEILGMAGLVDLVTHRGFSDTRTSYYLKPERYSDYLLVNPEVNVNDFQVVSVPEISDHRPLFIDFR